MSEPWNISGLILDGVCGTGKSAVFKALLYSERFKKRSFTSTVVLSEHQTQRVLEQAERDGKIEPSDNFILLDRHVTYLEALKARLDRMEWCRNGSTAMRIPFVFERFHFTHIYHYSYMRWEMVADIDRRLAALNGKLCLFVADEKTLAKRLFTGRDEAWLNYLKRIGDSEEKIVSYYIEKQELLIGLCDRSVLDTLIVDTTNSSVENTLDLVIDFWGVI